MAGKLQLQPGDILLYRPTPFQWKSFWTWPFGQLISIKTWHKISHVEIYDGQLESVASRDGAGVGRYPFRINELTYVLRPNGALKLSAARAWFDSLKGTPYGWADLLEFVGAPVNRKGIVCSPFAAGYLRAAGWNVFPTDAIEKIAPFQFLDLVGPACSVAYDPAAIQGILDSTANVVPK